MIGKVLTVHKHFGTPGPYIPSFYQLEQQLHITESCEESKVCVCYVMSNIRV